MKQAFVSGASRGIGRAIAISLADAGFEVGFCYRSREAEASSLMDELNKKTKGYAFRFDLECVAEIPKLADEVLSVLPNLSVLVNNAGISSYGVFQDVDFAEFDRVLSVDFKSVFFLTQYLLPPMLSAKKGSIVNVSSIWGQTGASCEVLYSACKSAVNGFTKALAKELAPSGISVNAVAPGVVDTDMMKTFSEDDRALVCEEIPCGRFASSEEIASLVCYLAQNPGYLTGQILGVNGGMYC